MDARTDALGAAAEYVLRVREVAAGLEGVVATVGQLDVQPGAANVVPSRVRLVVDARAPDQERLDRLVAELGLEDAHYVIPPVELSPEVLREEVERRGAGRRAAVGCGPRRRCARGSRRRVLDALHPQPERRRQPLAG
jgi:acetylornithine deacetylase/succinyl-diaminopimelate desuccinylase-like protein